jgi:serine protease Do
MFNIQITPKNRQKGIGLQILILFSVMLITAFFTFIYSQEKLSAQNSPKLNLGEPLAANAFIELSRVVNPTVVNISTARMPRRRESRQGLGRDPFFDLFEQYLGPQAPQSPEQALGTGFIIRADGLILTNNHVVAGADIVKVQLSETDKTLYTAEVKGRDQRTDIALIKIDTKVKLPVAQLGTSSNLQVGEWVAAIGNPFGHGHTITKGIVSAKGRELDEINRLPFIQTDASINPGNSGGPLVNLKAEVIGVNTAIDARAQGIGFAIPIDDVKAIIQILEKDGHVRRGFLGVNMNPYPINPQAAKEIGLPTTSGALIIGILDNSPASAAGLKAYDLITKFNGREIKNSNEFSRAVSDSTVGETYPVEYYRGSKKMTAKVKLAEHPDDKKIVSQATKTYSGQKAPYELGFSVANWTKDLSDQFRLAPLKTKYPIIINVEFDSRAAKAGLGAGDVIIDVNLKEVTSAIDVLKNLKKGEINSIRILRGTTPMLVYINSED